jgi:hypothetical protein
MAKRDPPLKLPDDFDGNLRALLQTPPAPHDTAGSRKSKPKAAPKPKKRTAPRRPPAVQRAPAGTYAYESAPVQVRTKKAAKKR